MVLPIKIYHKVFSYFFLDLGKQVNKQLISKLKQKSKQKIWWMNRSLKHISEWFLIAFLIKIIIIMKRLVQEKEVKLFSQKTSLGA